MKKLHIIIITILLLLTACSAAIFLTQNPAATVTETSALTSPYILSTEITQSAEQPSQTDSAQMAEKPCAGQLTAHFINVGQGDCEFIELPNNETMLIDAGDSGSGPEITAYIKNLGYDTINYLVATHPHADHIGGMSYVIKNLNIIHMYMPKVSTNTKTFENLLQTILDMNISVEKAESGTEILNTENLKIGILAPDSEAYKNLNNYSAVIKMDYKNTSFLFMGDAEKETEVKLQDEDVQADVLKVGHHGSDTSSTTAFLEKVTPKYAIISCGKNNKYGHPDSTVLQNLESIGSVILRTDQLGTIIIRSDGTLLTQL